MSVRLLFVYYSMKEIKLSQRGKNKSLNLVALVDDNDFDYLNQWKWFADKYKNGWYAGRQDYSTGKKKYLKMHRVILGITDSKLLGEHADRNGLNNQRSNLRVATKSQNAINVSSRYNSTSNYLGVCWHKREKKWRAQITKDYKKIQIGSFDNEHEAAIAYNQKAVQLFGEFANLNKIAS